MSLTSLDGENRYHVVVECDGAGVKVVAPKEVLDDLVEGTEICPRCATTCRPKILDVGFHSDSVMVPVGGSWSIGVTYPRQVARDT